MSEEPEQDIADEVLSAGDEASGDADDPASTVSEPAPETAEVAAMQLVDEGEA